jgi:hypothetical protein
VRLPEGEARARFAAVPVVRLGTADGQGGHPWWSAFRDRR